MPLNRRRGQGRASLRDGLKAMARNIGEIARSGALWRILGWGGAGLILLTPLVAMQFTREVAWDLPDFIFIGGLLGGMGLALELAVRKSGSLAYRVAVGLALLTAVLLIWINAAVGVIGDEAQGANILYLGVILLALVGALAARFRAAGMAWAMGAAGLANLAIPAIVIGFWPDARASVSTGLVVLNSIFAALWLVSALLFRRAGQTAPAP